MHSLMQSLFLNCIDLYVNEQIGMCNILVFYLFKLFTTSPLTPWPPVTCENEILWPTIQGVTPLTSGSTAPGGDKTFLPTIGRKFFTVNLCTFFSPSFHLPGSSLTSLFPPPLPLLLAISSSACDELWITHYTFITARLCMSTFIYILLITSTMFIHEAPHWATPTPCLMAMVTPSVPDVWPPSVSPGN